MLRGILGRKKEKPARNTSAGGQLSPREAGTFHSPLPEDGHMGHNRIDNGNSNSDYGWEEPPSYDEACCNSHPALTDLYDLPYNGVYQRTVRFQKPVYEPLGMSVSLQDNELVVARIVPGGYIDRYDLLQLGDVIKCVDDVKMYTAEQIIKHIKKSKGRVCLIVNSKIPVPEVDGHGYSSDVQAEAHNQQEDSMAVVASAPDIDDISNNENTQVHMNSNSGARQSQLECDLSMLQFQYAILEDAQAHSPSSAPQACIHLQNSDMICDNGIPSVMTCSSYSPLSGVGFMLGLSTRFIRKREQVLTNSSLPFIGSYHQDDDSSFYNFETELRVLQNIDNIDCSNIESL